MYPSGYEFLVKFILFHTSSSEGHKTVPLWLVMFNLTQYNTCFYGTRNVHGLFLYHLGSHDTGTLLQNSMILFSIWSIVVLVNGHIQCSKCWLSVRPGEPKKSPDNQKYWCSCLTDNHKSVAKTHFCICVYLYTVFQVRTTRNCNLVVCETTIYFSLIRMLLLSPLT